MLEFMKPIPEDVIDRIKDILSEHAEAFVVIIERDDDDTKQTETYVDWRGGLSRCIGMATRVANRLVKTANDRDE